jgi:hypothetical protein
MERRYADFLRNEKGLAELSLHVYLPLVQGNRQVNGKDPFGFGNRQGSRSGLSLLKITVSLAPGDAIMGAEPA